MGRTVMIPAAAAAAVRILYVSLVVVVSDSIRRTLARQKWRKETWHCVEVVEIVVIAVFDVDAEMIGG